MAIPLLCLLCLRPVGAVAPSFAPEPLESPALSTEDFLNRLGVNTHVNGLTASDPWNTNAAEVGAQLRYLGVRLDRDWAGSVTDGVRWKAVQTAWSPLGRFWTSINEGSPQTQRQSLAATQAIWSAYPHLIYAMGGPNEEDDDYARGQGATLPDAAVGQGQLYSWARGGGRQIPVSQMELGAGWTAANNWQGDYNPAQTGIGQPYTPGPADFAAAHTYLSNANQIPVNVLNQVGTLALKTTPGKPVAHTEVGAYQGAKLSPEEYGQFLVMGALDSVRAGDVGYLVYGLQDSGPEQTFGFFTYPGGKANPAADYFHTLTTLLQSTRLSYGPGERPTFTPERLAASFSSATVSHLTLQKPTGEFVVAVWTEQRLQGKPAESLSVVDTVRFGRSFATAQVYDVQQGLKPLATVENASECVVTVAPNHTYLIVLSGKVAAQPGLAR